MSPPPSFNTSRLSSISEVADLINETIFRDIYRKNGSHYLSHLQKVEEKVRTLGIPQKHIEKVGIVARIHDTIECGRESISVFPPGTPESQRDKSLNRILSRFGKIGEDICYMVHRETHFEEEEGYDDYISRLFDFSTPSSERFILDVYTTLVKLADNWHNFSDDNLKGKDELSIKFNRGRAGRADMFIKRFSPLFEYRVLANRQIQNFFSIESSRDVLYETLVKCFEILEHSFYLTRELEGLRTTKKDKKSSLKFLFPYIKSEGAQFGAYRKMPFPSGYRPVINEVLEDKLY